MQYIADLHIHSLHSRATSRASHLHGLAAWAAIKGIDVVGTGDFTHPGWLSHLAENLVEAEPGFFRLKDIGPDRYSKDIPEGLEPDISRVRFVLTAEISSIYKRGDRVRKVHNILFAPDFVSVRRINVALSAIGNLESDGRPILGLDSRNLLEIMLEKAPQGFLVPAHIWTPWFSLFGSKSGFDTIEECFGDLTGHIFALETGLSSDPDMNRMISALDGYSLISNSDCHSPGKLGREANIFTTGYDFFSMLEALRHPADDDGRQRFAATIEFYPEEGKYHCDGHRKCGVCFDPRETRDHNGICPQCGRPLTVGVLSRVMELADRSHPLYPGGSPAVHSLVPLPELLGELLQVGPGSKKVMRAYVKLVRQFGSEFAILLERDPSDIELGSSVLLAEAIRRVRSGRVIRRPGFDGEFGVIRVFSDKERKGFGGQMALFEPPETRKSATKNRRFAEIPTVPVKVRKKKKAKKKELNPEQQEIVESEARHILVKAGPGTGKTHTLVQRIARLTASRHYPCTVITFTNRAAEELQARLRALTVDTTSIHVSTLHGFCLQWLRRQKRDIRVAGPEMRRWLLRQLAGQGMVDDEKTTGCEIAEFLQQALHLRKAVPASLAPYFSRLEAEGFVDIDAVVPELAALLFKDDETARIIRQGTGALFIDEFQDLNRSQYEVVRLLAATSPVFAIGDPDQAIYGFRGSSPVWFYRFLDDLKPAQFFLRRNYRSSQAIVEAANHLISHNPHPGPEVMNMSCASARGKIFLRCERSPRDEAQFVVREVEKLMGGTTHREIDRLQQCDDTQDVTLSDIAVLYRTSRQADILASALYEHGFPVQVVDILPYFVTGPVQPLYLWVLLAADRADGTDLLAILEKETGMGKSRLQEVERHLPVTAANVLKEAGKQIAGISAPVTRKIMEITALRDQVVDTAAVQGVCTALHLLCPRYGIEKDNPDCVRFMQMAENFGTSLANFAHHLRLHTDSVVYDARADAVTLMTLHAAKGLEFKVVFLVGLEEGLLPFALRRGESKEQEERFIEEERRLLYVGMTRAEEMLYLSHVLRRSSGGAVVQQKSSRFLSEIPDGLVVPLERGVRKRKGGGKVHQLSLFADKK